MIKKICLIFSALIVLSAGWLLAKDYWEKPFQEWKQKEVVRMLSDSPWAFESSVTQQWGGRGGTWGTGTSAGEREHFQTYTLRFLSALPIRQAYVRFFQMAEGYDDATAQQKERLDQKYSGPLNLDVSEKIIVAMEFKSNNRELQMQVNRTLATATMDLLKQQVFLITEGHGRIELAAFQPPSPTQPFSQFIFPRQVDGSPVVTADHKEVKFEMWAPGTGQKIFFTKKIKTMMYDGKLEI